MKTASLALALGLASSLAASSALASTGPISFEGMITTATCPIEIINPGDGSVGGLVKMPSVSAGSFTAVDQERGGKEFVMKVLDGSTCSLGPAGTATVTFNGAANGNYFAVAPGPGAAQGFAISLRDATSKPLAPGVKSDPYPIANTGETQLSFFAYYRSISTSRVAGGASATLTFLLEPV